MGFEGSIGFWWFLAIVGTGLVVLGVKTAQSPFLVALTVITALLCVAALWFLWPLLAPTEGSSNFAAGMLAIHVGIPLAYASAGALLLVASSWITRIISNRNSHSLDQFEEEL
jgi:hypothetical protein